LDERNENLAMADEAEQKGKFGQCISFFEKVMKAGIKLLGS